MRYSSTNDVLERAFATLYGRIQAMLNYANIEGDIHKLLWELQLI